MRLLLYIIEHTPLIAIDLIICGRSKRDQKHTCQYRYGVEMSIKELAETIKRIVGFSGELYFNTDKPDGTMRKLTDPPKLHALGWRHTVELGEGIERMYDWYLKFT